MVWSEIISIIFGGTTLASSIALIRFWSADKVLKREELRQADSTSDLAEINVNNEQIRLGQLYLKSVEELGNKMLNESKSNQEEVIQRIDKLDTKVDNLKVRLDNMEEYLNGDYKTFKKKRQNIVTK